VTNRQYTEWILVKFVLPSQLVCKPATFGAYPKPGQIGRVAAGRAFGVKWGNDGAGTVISGGVASTRTVGASVSIIIPCTTKSRNNDGEKQYCWVSPCGRLTCLRKQEVGKPSLNAA